MPVSGAVLTPGKYGQGYSLDGADDYITLSGVLLGNGLSKLTICMWVYVRSISATNGRILLSRDNASYARSFVLYMAASTGRPTMVIGSTTVATSLTNWATGAWAHIAMVYVGSTRVTIYRDAEMDIEGTASIPASIPATNMPPHIGRFEAVAPDNRQINGIVDEVSVWSAALSVPNIRRVMLGLTPIITSSEV
jgi:hypothetical protein